MFWLKACHLLDDQGSIARVGFEHGPKGFDDLWIEYEPGSGKLDAQGRCLSIERFQCKWHVGLGSFTHADLTKPEFINATAHSFLQRAHGAHLKASGVDDRSMFKLVTNWRVAPDDPLHGLIRTRSSTLRVDDLFLGKTERSASGRVRQVWREHLQISDDELRALAHTLAFGQVLESLDQLRESLDQACRISGLRRIPQSDSSVPYDDIVFQWAGQGRHVFDRKTFREACAQERLFEGSTSPVSVFGVKSFEHPFDRLEDRCVNVLDLVSEFDERFIRDATAWETTLVPQLQKFLLEVARTDSRLRLAVDAHTTLAFVAGSVLDAKSGRTVELEQRAPSRVVWAPDDREPTSSWAAWNVDDVALADGDGDIALAVGITHDVEPKVRQFVASQLPSVHSLLVFKPAGGPSPSAIACGAHANALAEELAARLKARRDSAGGKRARVHLFIAGPNGFSFYLGRHVRSLKPLTLYEFDFEGQRDGSYVASLSVPPASAAEHE